MLPNGLRSITFGDFRFYPQENALFQNGKSISLTPKMADTLVVLLQNPGRIVNKNDLLQAVWPDSFVEEGNLTVTIRQLRKALGDDARDSRYIETVPKRGYRFISEVTEVNAKDVETISEQPISAKSPIRPSSVKRVALAIAAIAIISLFTVLILKRLNAALVQSEFPVLVNSFNTEKVSASGRTLLASISQDGKMVVYTNEVSDKTGVWVRQINSDGNNVEVVPAADFVYGGVAMSPDDNFIYFARRPTEVAGPFDIYRLSILGGTAKKIASQTEGWISISPDGETISFVRDGDRPDEHSSLWIARSSDGENEKRLIFRPAPIEISDNKISPDGNLIAFAVGQTHDGSNNFRLGVVDLRDGAEQALSQESFFNIKGLAWIPDQSALLFTARKNTDEYFRIWKLSIASGAVEPVTNNSQTYSDLSLDRGGETLVATQITPEFHLQLYDLVPDAKPRLNLDGLDASFAPDGKIVFTSAMSGSYNIWRVANDGSNLFQITNDVGPYTLPIVSPDSSSIYFSSNRSGSDQVWRMDIDGGNQIQLTHSNGGLPLMVTPDQKWVYYQERPTRKLWRVSTSGGDEHLAFDRRKRFFALSPDARFVVFEDEREGNSVMSIASIPDGKIVRQIEPGKNPTNLWAAAWMPDSKALVYTTSDARVRHHEIWVQPLETGSAKKLFDFDAEWFNTFAISPDGKSLLITPGTWKHDCLLIKGLK